MNKETTPEMDEQPKKRTLSEICEELCPGVRARNAGAFTREPGVCLHGLKNCDSPLCRETTPVTVPGEQRDCACGGNGKHYTFHSSESCGVEPKVEQRGDTPQPVDSNEVVTKRNQLEAQPLPAATTVDEIITSLYRRFKDWSKRGFGPDDVTWCEVKADILQLVAYSKPVWVEIKEGCEMPEIEERCLIITNEPNMHLVTFGGHRDTFWECNGSCGISVREVEKWLRISCPSMSYCESCGKENCKTVKAAGCNVCAKCAKILKEKGLA